MPAPTPPDQTAWWDAAAVKAGALAVLRLTEGDPDDQRIADLVPVAGWLINDKLDRAAPPPAGPVPAPLDQAMVMATVVLYRGKDAPATTIDGLLAGTLSPSAADAVAAVWPLIRGSKQRFGVA